MIDLKERHEYWWDYLLERVWVPERFNDALPTFELTTKLSRVAAKADLRHCEYNLNYVLQEDDKYDETICHEICHVFSKRLCRQDRHGSLWYYLYNVVCESNRGRYHSYSTIKNKTDRTPEMVTMRELLKLQKKIAACKSKP